MQPHRLLAFLFIRRKQPSSEPGHTDLPLNAPTFHISSVDLHRQVRHSNRGDRWLWFSASRCVDALSNFHRLPIPDFRAIALRDRPSSDHQLLRKSGQFMVSRRTPRLYYFDSELPKHWFHRVGNTVPRNRFQWLQRGSWQGIHRS